MKRLASLPTSRRALFVAGGAAIAAVGAGSLLLRPKAGPGRHLGDIDTRNISALGEGFYLVDGWVLTGEDLASMGLSAPGAATP